MRTAISSGASHRAHPGAHAPSGTEGTQRDPVERVAAPAVPEARWANRFECVRAWGLCC